MSSSFGAVRSAFQRYPRATEVENGNYVLNATSGIEYPRAAFGGQGGQEEFQHVLQMLQQALTSGDYTNVLTLRGSTAQRAGIIAQTVGTHLMTRITSNDAKSDS